MLSCWRYDQIAALSKQVKGYSPSFVHIYTFLYYSIGLKPCHALFSQLSLHALKYLLSEKIILRQETF